MSIKISEHMEVEMAKFFMRTSVPRIIKKRRQEEREKLEEERKIENDNQTV